MLKQVKIHQQRILPSGIGAIGGRRYFTRLLLFVILWIAISDNNQRWHSNFRNLIRDVLICRRCRPRLFSRRETSKTVLNQLFRGLLIQWARGEELHCCESRVSIVVVINLRLRGLFGNVLREW